MSILSFTKKTVLEELRREGKGMAIYAICIAAQCMDLYNSTRYLEHRKIAEEVTSPEKKEVVVARKKLFKISNEIFELDLNLKKEVIPILTIEEKIRKNPKINDVAKIKLLKITLETVKEIEAKSNDIEKRLLSLEKDIDKKTFDWKLLSSMVDHHRGIITNIILLKGKIERRIKFIERKQALSKMNNTLKPLHSTHKSKKIIQKARAIHMKNHARRT